MHTCLKGILFACLLTGCCLSARGQPLSFDLRQMEGFYLQSNISLEKGLNFFVIRTRRDFIRHFGLINKPDTPNFSREQVVVMALPPSAKESKLAFMPVGKKAGHYVEIYCVPQINIHRLTYTTYPIVVAAMPRYLHVTEINFYHNTNKKLLRKVRL